MCSSIGMSYSIELSGVPHHLNSHIEENDTPITWAHPTTGGRLNSPEENDAPTTWGTTQLSHRGERCPIMWVCPTLGSLLGRLKLVSEENVPWRMSHEAAIIKTPSQLGKHSQPGQVSHISTQTSYWKEVW